MAFKFSISATVNTQAIVRAMSKAAPVAVRAAADVFVDREKENVPVLSGNLRDHIDAVEVFGGPYFVQMIVAPAQDAANAYGFDPAYARRIEFGFFGADSLGRMYHQAAQPYVRPAWDEGQSEALNAAEEVFAGAVGGAA